MAAYPANTIRSYLHIFSILLNFILNFIATRDKINDATPIMAMFTKRWNRFWLKIMLVMKNIIVDKPNPVGTANEITTGNGTSIGRMQKHSRKPKTISRMILNIHIILCFSLQS